MMLKSEIPEIEIYSCQGHDSLTSMRHYQVLAFSGDELRDIKKEMIAWGL